MQIPRAADLPWTRITLAVIAASEDGVDLETFSSRLGGGKSWVITDPKAIECSTTVEIVDSHNSIFFQTLIAREEDDGEAERVSFEDAMSALKDAWPATGLASCGVNLQVEYPASTEWRLPLLAQPPALEANDLGLGKMSLAGITLRFKESPLGVGEARLDTSFSGDTRNLGLTYLLSVSKAEVPNLFAALTERGQSLASLFVKLGSPATNQESVAETAETR